MNFVVRILKFAKVSSRDTASNLSTQAFRRHELIPKKYSLSSQNVSTGIFRLLMLPCYQRIQRDVRHVLEYLFQDEDESHRCSLWKHISCLLIHKRVFLCEILLFRIVYIFEDIFISFFFLFYAKIRRIHRMYFFKDCNTYICLIEMWIQYFSEDINRYLHPNSYDERQRIFDFV